MKHCYLPKKPIGTRIKSGGTVVKNLVSKNYPKRTR